MTEPSPQALLEDYKLKVTHHSEVIGRYLVQSQVFVGLEAAVATALVIKADGLSAVKPGGLWMLIVITLAWVAVGWRGRTNVVAARAALHRAGDAWAASEGFPSTHAPVGAGYPAVTVGLLAPLVVLALWVLLLATR